MTAAYIQTGQTTCYDAAGNPVPCAGSGQDAELCRGQPWPSQRFRVLEESEGRVVRDYLTGLQWSRDASLSGYPLNWQEALDFVARMNEQGHFGHDDWRLPNRRELRSLISHQARNPALPEHNPFENIVLTWYWTSTTAAINTAYAWYMHMEGARTFYGGKDQYFLLWPVRGHSNGTVPATGQAGCFDHEGNEIPCGGSGQDGEHQSGLSWPSERFELAGDSVIDHLTGLRWMKTADLDEGPATWEQALAAAAGMNPPGAPPAAGWRLPNINELESLVDLSRHSPALPEGHLFNDLQEGYWSSTSSAFEPDWAWALYLDKGAIGIGQKKGAHFSAWAVKDSF